MKVGTTPIHVVFNEQTLIEKLAFQYRRQIQFPLDLIFANYVLRTL